LQLVSFHSYFLVILSFKWPNGVHGVHATPTLGSPEAGRRCFFTLSQATSQLKLCGRPQHQLNVDKLNKNVNICSKLSQQRI